jgi:hypothetical protein
VLQRDSEIRGIECGALDVMLVPYNARTCEVSWEHTIVMDGGGTSPHETFYETFYEALLAIPWLPPKVRGVIMGELGRSLRKEKRDIEYARTATLSVLINERKKRLREKGQHPRGGVHEKAVEEIAQRQGMTVAALKKRLQRYKRRQKN